MRLTVDEHGLIREGTRQEIGPDRTVRLFGSRLDDSRRGGDIDWLVERNKAEWTRMPDDKIERPSMMETLFGSKLGKMGRPKDG